MRRFIAALATLLCVTACDTASQAHPSASPSAPAVPAPVAEAPAGPLNIVFVLTDDLAGNLVPYMPNVQALAADGVSFTDYTVTDSLCCPSRASILTGKYPHNTGVFTNTGADGGLKTFQRYANERSTFATDLASAGYRTGFFGKYINGYQPERGYVPEGWTTWVAGGDAYRNFDYDLYENGKVIRYGHEPADYLTDVLSAKASRFIQSSAAAGQPFLVEVSTFAPHLPYTPAPRDAASFADLKAPRDPSFGAFGTGASPWLSGHPALTTAEIDAIDRDFRQRVRAVQSVDRMLGSLRQSIATAGVADRTVVVFTSDNGLHMGEHGLKPGKQTAFDTDVNVPLIAAGPGVARGDTVALPAENIDLRPTFAALAGAPVPADVDGASLVPLLRGSPAPQWREVALIEHHGPPRDPADPDYQPWFYYNPGDYRALRTPSFTYVAYGDGSQEYYDNATDPFQTRNIAGSLPADELTRLKSTLEALAACRGERACRSAGR